MIFLAPEARAQGFFNFDSSSPERIERRLESAGYALRGPLYRRGDVYICDVVNEIGGRERLVVDARTGTIVGRFRTHEERWREARDGDWRDRDDDWRDRDADDWNAPPRPPKPFAQHPQGDAQRNWGDNFAPPPQPRPHDQIAGVDPSAKPPNVIYGEDRMNVTGPSAESDKPKATDADKPKVKPRVVKKKPAPSAKPPASEAAAPAPPPNSSTAGVSPPADTRTPPSPPAKVEADAPVPAGEAKRAADAKPVEEAAPVPEAKPSTVAEPKPAAEVKPVAEARPAAETKPVPEVKPAPAAKPVAEAKVAAPAPVVPEPRPEKKPKPVNDVPVNPLD